MGAMALSLLKSGFSTCLELFSLHDMHLRGEKESSVVYSKRVKLRLIAVVNISISEHLASK